MDHAGTLSDAGSLLIATFRNATIFFGSFIGVFFYTNLIIHLINETVGILPRTKTDAKTTQEPYIEGEERAGAHIVMAAVHFLTVLVFTAFDLDSDDEEIHFGMDVVTSLLIVVGIGAALVATARAVVYVKKGSGKEGGKEE